MQSFPEAKILFIDLLNRSFKVTHLDSETYRKYPGGSALGMYLLLKYLPPKIDPLSPDNILIFSVSPLTGIPISGQSRMNVATKSPLTDTAGDSQVGGFIGPHIKGNGYDAIVFMGKSETPVYLYIDQDHVEFKDGKNVWGKVTGDAEKIIEEEIGDKDIESCIIGQAGENLVKYASIMHRRSRANGRNGVGAVMGSKNVKALVLKKQRSNKPIDPQGLKSLTKGVKDRIEKNEAVADIGINGTAGATDYINEEGFMPTKNWTRGFMETGEKIYGVTMTKTILKERDTCFACAIRCKRVVEVENKVDPNYGGPEYETIGSFGSYCLVDNLEDIAYANQLCNMYGLDTISCGATIAFAMECYERGILTEKDTDGLDLSFGNSGVFKDIIPKIALRTPGIGNLLAHGSARAAEQIGQGSEEFVITCKKQELPVHMPHMKPNLAINYAVNPFGADHQSSEHDTALMAPKDSVIWQRVNMLADFESCGDYGVLDDNKVKFAFETQKFYSTLDTLCLCQFAWGPSWQLYGPDDLVKFCKYAIDWDTSIEELQEIGERRINMMKLFNVREGFTKCHDNLPKRMFKALPDVPGAGQGGGVSIKEEDFVRGIDSYYKFAGWDVDSGAPLKSTIERLGLTWISGGEASR